MASGGEASGSGGNASYSIGQMDYIYQTSATDGSVSQGIQQAFEIFIYTGAGETGINLTTSVYPNPTIESLTLKVDGDLLTNLFYQLYDEQGRLIVSSKIEGVETTIIMSQLASAKYFLKVINDNKEIKTFKIIKIK